MDSAIPTSPSVYLLVGLGNLGRQYAHTRHNIGFLVIDRLAARLETLFSRVQLRSLVTDARYQGRRVLLAKPQTYMNDSGVAVGSLVKFYKVPLTNLLVAHDDVDLPFGTLRLRPGGGLAGQKGVASIQERLGTQDFPRLRVGVSRPPGNKLAAAYVLQDFSKQEAEFLPALLDHAVDATLSFMLEGLEKTMTRYNGEVGGRMIEIIAFDADDTLWHNETLYNQAKVQFQALLAPFSSSESVRQRLDEIEEWNVRHYGYGIKSFALSMVEAAIEISHGQIEAPRLSRILDIAKDMLNADVKPLEPVEPTLTELARQFPLMLITKGDFFEQHHKIERSGLAKYFRYIEIVVDKTPETYRGVLGKYHLEPQKFLMVGNSLRSDILPVLEIGGQAVYIPYASTWAHERVDESALRATKYLEIEHLGQLPELIRNL